MSAETIARWNAIPMERPDTGPTGTNSMKRSRDDDDYSDDDVSLISRSPSPPPRNDTLLDIGKYDEYARGVEREVITVDTKINRSNKGFAMLAKLGWVEGTPLGLSGDGRVDPVPFVLKNDLTGLGKTNQDVRMIETTVAQRRELDSERQTKETEEQRRAREESVAKRAAVQSEISSVLRAFYCDLCEKQFQTVAQDMQAVQKVTFGASVEDRKEKERKREEKELRKLAKAAGIKLTKPATSPATGAGLSQPVTVIAGEPSEQKTTGSTKSGWATLGSTSTQPSGTSTSSASNPPRSGSSTVRSSTNSDSPSSSRNGWAPVSQPQPPSPPPPPPCPGPAPAPSRTNAAPTFRTGGWTSLDTSSSSPSTGPSQPVAPPSAPPPAASTPLPPSPSQSRGSTTVAAAPEPPARSGWTAMPLASATSQPPAPASASAPAPVPAPVSAQPAPPISSQPKAQRQEAARSGWQQFKAGGNRRR